MIQTSIQNQLECLPRCRHKKVYSWKWVHYGFTGEPQVKGGVGWRVCFGEIWWGKLGESEMHCLLTITQSTLVPSLGCDCAGGQSPDSAHPFPEGELWKPKTEAIPSLSSPTPLSSSAPVSPSLCLYLPLPRFGQ